MSRPSDQLGGLRDNRIVLLDIGMRREVGNLD
jgi:hypothetical protein